jgi:hypothetical protein
LKVKVAPIAPKRITDNTREEEIKLKNFFGLTDEMERKRKEDYHNCARKFKGKREIEIPVSLN